MKSKFIILIISTILMTSCTLSKTPIKTDSSNIAISPAPTKSAQSTKTYSSYEDLSTSPVNLTEATVTKVADGDTIYVKIKNKSYKVRLIGINCPEYTKEIQFYGKESTEYTKNQLLQKKVYLETDVSNTDKYDRLLRYIWLDIPTDINEQEIRSKMFNSVLVIEGFARAGYYPPDTKYTDYLKVFQQEAKDEKKGMWSNQSSN